MGERKIFGIRIPSLLPEGISVFGHLDQVSFPPVPTKTPQPIEAAHPKRHHEPLLNPKVAEFLTDAFNAESEGKEDESRDLYERASALAMRVYEETVGLTDEDRSSLGMHAEIAVNALSNAGEQDEALVLADEILTNPALPGISRQRIQKTVNMLSGAS